jgi:UDP-N-acetylglucosamine 2-epimerase
MPELQEVDVEGIPLPALRVLREENMKAHIWTPVFTRSELGPLGPLVEKAKESKDIVFNLDDMRRIQKDHWLNHAKKYIDSYKPDLVLCGFDRPEMSLIAWQVYHMDVPMVQIFAGDLAGGAHDDADRFTISNYSDLLFCADQPQYERMQRTLAWRKPLGTFPEIYISGATHFDDMRFEVPDLPSPFEPYVLVLYNPPSFANTFQMELELLEIQKVCEGKKVLWAQPNGDKDSAFVRGFAALMKNTTLLPEMSRWDFLGYLNSASLFVGNSSCLFYEAPYFGIPVKQIGMRNKHRETISRNMMNVGASEEILGRIREFLAKRGE